MSDNPLADMVNNVNRIVTPHLEGISRNINEKLDRRLRRKELEEKVIVDHARLRLQEENYEAGLQNKARQISLYEQKANADLDIRRRSGEAEALESISKATNDQILALEARRLAASVDGVGLEAIDNELNALKSKQSEYRTRLESVAAPTQQDRIGTTAPQTSTQLNIELPQRVNGDLGFESYDQASLFKRTPADNSIISQKAVAWEGQNFKKGEYARCADFVCSVLEESGIKLDEKRSDLVYALNNDKFGEYVPPGEFMPGDVVILKDTYDAEHGYDETHTGIYEERNGRPGMIHRPTRSKEVMWSPIDKDSDYAGKVMNGRRVRPPSPEEFYGPAPDAEFESNVTVYSPQSGGDGVQGGLESAKPGPDGVNQVRTIDDVFNGRSEYITLAGNPKFYGQEYIVKNVQYQPDGPDGPTYTIPEVRGVVHDTGSAFSDAPEGRFDIPVAANVGQEVRNRHDALFKKAGVSFTPVTQQVRATPVGAEVTATPMPQESAYELLEAPDNTSYSFDDPEESENGPLVIDDLAASTGSVGVLASAPNAGAGIIKNVEPERKKIGAADAKSIYAKSLTIIDEKLKNQALSIVSNKIRETNPEIFDDEIKSIAQEFSETGSRVDFEKAIPEEVVALVGKDRAIGIFQEMSTQYKVEQRRTKDFEEKSTRLKTVEKDLDDAELNLIRAQSKRGSEYLEPEVQKYQAIVDRYKQERDRIAGELEGLQPTKPTEQAQLPSEPEKPKETVVKQASKGLDPASSPTGTIAIDNSNSLAGRISEKFGIDRSFINENSVPDKQYNFFEKYFGGEDINAAVDHVMSAYINTEKKKFQSSQDSAVQFDAARTFLQDDENLDAVAKLAAIMKYEVNYRGARGTKQHKFSYRIDNPDVGVSDEDSAKLREEDRKALLENPADAVALVRTFLKKDLRSDIKDAIVRDAALIEEKKKKDAITILTGADIPSDL